MSANIIQNSLTKKRHVGGSLPLDLAVGPISFLDFEIGLTLLFQSRASIFREGKSRPLFLPRDSLPYATSQQRTIRRNALTSSACVPTVFVEEA